MKGIWFYILIELPLMIKAVIVFSLFEIPLMLLFLFAFLSIRATYYITFFFKGKEVADSNLSKLKKELFKDMDTEEKNDERLRYYMQLIFNWKGE